MFKAQKLFEQFKNNQGSFELTPNEVVEYQDNNKWNQAEYNRMLLDGWKENMGIDFPISDDLESIEKSMPDAERILTEHANGTAYNPTSRHDLVSRIRRELDIDVFTWPNVTKAAKLASVAYTPNIVYLPQNTVYLMLMYDHSNLGNVYASLDNGLQNVLDAPNGTVLDTSLMCGPAMLGKLIYVEGVNSITLFGPAGATVLAACWTTTI